MHSARGAANLEWPVKHELAGLCRIICCVTTSDSTDTVYIRCICYRVNQISLEVGRLFWEHQGLRLFRIFRVQGFRV